MNDTKLNRPFFSDEKYKVFLDSENKFSFTNKRKARDFITIITREIDKSTLLITEELNTLVVLYRLYFFADKDYKFKFSVNNSIEFVNDRLAWIGEHFGSENHDPILFQGILNCFDELVMAYDLIRKKAHSRKDTITKRRCALRIDIINLFKERFLKIGIKPAIMHLKIKRVATK